MAGCRNDRRSNKRGAKRGLWQGLLVAIAAAPLLGPAPALAQWFSDPPLPPQAVVRIVAQHGFTDFSPPRLSGDVYIVHAVDDDGARVRLVIDAHDGRILRPARAVRDIPSERPIGRIRPRDYASPPEADFEEGESVERLRPPGFDEDLVPPRSVGRLRQRGYASPEFDNELEEESVERFRMSRPSREELLPPRSGRGRAPGDGFSRETEYEREPVEPFRAPEVSRALTPTVREPAPRVEPPAREPAAATRPRGADRSGASPAAPAPVVEKKADQPAGAKATTTAAVPAPPVPKETVPATPAAPLSRPAKPEAQIPTPAAKPAKAGTPAAQPAATASAAPKVRVIEGVTPIQPHKPAADAGSSSEPQTVAQ